MGEPGNLTHPEAPGDTGHPIFYNLHGFPRRCFACFPYHHEGGGYAPKKEVVLSGVTCLISPYDVKT